MRKVEKRRTITRKRRKVKELKNFDKGVWERGGQSQERGEKLRNLKTLTKECGKEEDNHKKEEKS